MNFINLFCITVTKYLKWANFEKQRSLFSSQFQRLKTQDQINTIDLAAGEGLMAGVTMTGAHGGWGMKRLYLEVGGQRVIQGLGLLLTYS